VLLQFETVKNSLLHNRCLFSQAALNSSEFVVSSTRVPSLYKGPLISTDKSKIREIVKVLVCCGDEVQSMISSDPGMALRIRSFFGLCIAHGEQSEEAFLHAYMFLFWGEIAREVDLGRKLHNPVFWASKEFGLAAKGLTKEQQAIQERLASCGVEVDLFTLSPEMQTISLIEIKRGECDDRAIGQLLRYYQSVWQLLSHSDFRKLNLNYVWPVLVVHKVRQPQLSALPFHYLGLLDILVYDIQANGVPNFTSHRKAAISGKWI